MGCKMNSLELDIEVVLADDEEPTMPYARLGYDASDVGVSEIRVKRVSSSEWEVVIVRAA